MSARYKVSAKSYYTNPDPNHNTGDIWNNLPTHGLLKFSHCSGIIITPACDLANNKVETVTYLPIIPIDHWFSSRGFYPIIRTELLQQLKYLNISFEDSTFPKNQLPSKTAYSHIQILLNELSAASTKQKAAVEKLKYGLFILDKIISSNAIRANHNELDNFLGNKNHIDLKQKLIRNSLSNDLHFLPKDVLNIEWTAIAQHSIVLFRYPITCPIEILDLANDINCIDWNAGLNELKIRFKLADSFIDHRPIKTTKLNQEYLSDLLTRFVSVYMRLGSPDFSPDTIEEYIKEL